MLKKGLDMQTRILAEAMFFVKYNSTLRQTAVIFGVNKTTVHRDLTQKLPLILKEMPRYERFRYPQYEEIMAVIKKNKMERSTRGGRARRQKYLKLKAKEE